MEGWNWAKSLPPLALAVVLMAGAAIALERDNVDGAAGLASVAFLMVGVWLTILLHDRFKDDDHGRGGDDR